MATREKSSLFRKPWFWIAFAAAAVVATVGAQRYFAAAFPLVDLELTMDRGQALAAARQIAEQRAVGPARFRQAASFDLDSEVRSFVELEAGGREAFRTLLTSGRFQPYSWRVRHFREGEVREAELRFTPTGEPYGFVERLAEDAPGAAASAELARQIAERTANVGWGIDLATYELVEQGSETRPGGRVDHRLVYERRGEAGQLGEGRIRLRMVVGGLRVTALEHFVKVPEAFSRRYAEMRSDNDAIAFGGGVAMTILYLLGGCLGGLVWLLRHHFVIWKPAFLWGGVVALLQLLAGLNSWPLVWLQYDTALSIGGFVARQILLQGAGFLGIWMLMAVSFMAAESLGRKAFPHHLQLWRAWGKEAGATPLVLGGTVAAYLLIGLFFAYEVALYLFTSRALGWWTPSDALYDPNVLATYLPWLQAIAISLQAGFWEECLFRAVPLAGGALLGSWLDRRAGSGVRWRTAAIVLAFVLQAVIFGAGHANYPTEPAWARVVELIVPSFMFGGLYLAFGLLPGIVLHFAFDVVWFALPLFVASSPGIWVSRLVVIVLTLIPLWVVLFRRYQVGAWRELDPALTNRAWTAPELSPRVAEPDAPRPHTLPVRLQRGLLAAGLVGLVAWGGLGGGGNTAPRLELTGAEARELATAALAERGFSPGPPWRVLPTVSAGTDLTDRFVWQTGGEEAYRTVLGVFLPPPRWVIRVARFDGDVAERAEEWNVLLRDRATVRIAHAVPEGRAGAVLDEPAARQLAENAIRDRFGLDPAVLVAISATPSRHTERTDWSFLWRDPDSERYPLAQGEGRVGVEIAGDEVTQAFRTVHVPEEWEREQRSRGTTFNSVRIVAMLVLAVAFLLAIGFAILAVARRQVATRQAVIAAVLLALTGALSSVNAWPTAVAQFQTALPWTLQATLLVTGLVLAQLVQALGIGLLVGWLGRQAAERHADLHAGGHIGGFSSVAGLGVALGALVAGAATVAARFGERLDPPQADYAGAGTWWPTLGPALGSLTALLAGAGFLLFVAYGLDRWTNRFTRRRPLAVALLLVLGFAMVASREHASWPGLLVGGLLTGLLLVAAWVWVLRREPAAIPLAVATVLALSLFREGSYQAYPGAQLGSTLGAVLLLAVGMWWSWTLVAPPPGDDRQPAEAGHPVTG